MSKLAINHLSCLIYSDLRWSFLFSRTTLQQVCYSIPPGECVFFPHSPDIHHNIRNTDCCTLYIMSYNERTGNVPTVGQRDWSLWMMDDVTNVGVTCQKGWSGHHFLRRSPLTMTRHPTRQSRYQPRRPPTEKSTLGRANSRNVTLSCPISHPGWWWRQGIIRIFIDWRSTYGRERYLSPRWTRNAPSRPGGVLKATVHHDRAKKETANAACI